VLANELLFGDLTNGGRVKIDIKDGSLHCQVMTSKKKQEEVEVD
jgi:hypothetical protein